MIFISSHCPSHGRHTQYSQYWDLTLMYCLSFLSTPCCTALLIWSLGKVKKFQNPFNQMENNSLELIPGAIKESESLPTFNGVQTIWTHDQIPHHRCHVVSSFRLYLHGVRCESDLHASQTCLALEPGCCWMCLFVSPLPTSARHHPALTVLSTDCWFHQRISEINLFILVCLLHCSKKKFELNPPL